MSGYRIELIYFDGCPNAEQARANLAAATGCAEGEAAWREWNLDDEATPARYQRFGSPTVLVDGKDVMGSGRGTVARACRADGAPDVEGIRQALGA